VGRNEIVRPATVARQGKHRPADTPTLEANPWIADLTDHLHDFTDTAAMCECLDLVIAVDTSLAHLSAALGKPTWILLPFVPDFRWLMDRTDSPWYPTATLYRQANVGDWKGVLARLEADLLRRFAGPSGHGAEHLKGEIQQDFQA
jgi:hypothetical protein